MSNYTAEEIAFMEKIRTVGGIVKGGTQRFGKPSYKDMTEMYRENNNPLAEITKDKAMYKTITQGNASDKKLTADVTAIESARLNSRKTKSRDEKLGRIKALKENYRRKYGKDA